MENYWIAAILGAVVSGPIWVAVTVWSARRIWRTAKRLSARTKGQEHLAELGQLASGLAHEIKNPLSTINLNLKLLSEDMARSLDPECQRLLRRLSSVQEESNRLKGILDDFLRYAGKYELSLADIDIRRLVDELVVFFSPQASSSRIIMRTALPDIPVVCSVDGNLIKQAVLNLMINAVQAMADGGELLVKVTQDKTNASIEVIDTGPGIAPDQMPRIFQVYYSTKKGGSGLGLPTTRRIIREHGGEIRAESILGKGTRFLITLPLTANRTSLN